MHTCACAHPTLLRYSEVSRLCSRTAAAAPLDHINDLVAAFEGQLAYAHGGRVLGDYVSDEVIVRAHRRTPRQPPPRELGRVHAAGHNRKRLARALRKVHDAFRCLRIALESLNSANCFQIKATTPFLWYRPFCGDDPPLLGHSGADEDSKTVIKTLRRLKLFGSQNWRLTIFQCYP